MSTSTGMSGAEVPEGFSYRATIARTFSSDIHLVSRPGLGPRPVVVKVLRLSDPDDRRRFVESNELCQHLDHPNVIPVLEVGALPDGRPWMVMPFHRARSLADRLDERGSLPLGQVLHVVTRLADVLHDLHVYTGTVHRDVKPGNVLLGDDGEPVLTDLNDVGRLRADTGSLTTDRRSLYYAAPEVRLTGRYSIRSEVYSLGVTLVELLAGAQPFAAQPGEQPSAHAARWAAGVVPPHLLAGGPEDLRLLIARMLAPEPDRRPRDAAEVAAHLRAIQVECGSR